MAEMSAILKLQAKTEGKGQLEQMAQALGTIKKQGDNTTKSLEGIANSAGGLAGSFRSLVPLLSGAGLMALAQRSIETGDKLWDMSQRTGVSVERLSQLSKAAKLGGTDIDTVAMALQRMSRSMVAASDSTAELAKRQADDLKRSIDAVRRGEREQTDALQEQADRRLEVINRETDARMRALNRRYRQEQQLLSDRFDDQQSAQERQLQAQQDTETKAIGRQFDARRRAIQADKTLSDDAKQAALDSLRDQEDQALGVIRDGYRARQTELQRALRNQRQAEQDRIDDRKAREEQALRSSSDQRKATIQRETKTEIDALRQQALARIEALKGGPADTGDDLEGLNASKAAEAYRKLGIAVTDARGQLRNSSDVLIDVANKFKTMEDGVKKADLAQQLWGRGGQQLIPMLNEITDAILRTKGMTTAQAQASDQLSDAMVTLNGKIAGLGGKLAVALMPMLESTTNALVGLIDGFNKLNGPMQTMVAVGVGIAVAWGPLIGTFINTAKAITILKAALAGLAGAEAAAGAAGAAAGAGAAGGGGIAALTALILSPAGLIAALVLAGIAIYIFRDQITGALKVMWDAWTRFIGYLNDIAHKAFGAMWDLADKLFFGNTRRALGLLGEFWASIFNKYKEIAAGLFTWFTQTVPNALVGPFRAAADAITSIWTGIVGTIKSVINGALASIGNYVNGWINGINGLINAARNIPGAQNLPNLPQVPIPQLAAGAYLDRPTLAIAGEAGPEYVIPAARMPAAAAAFQAGARGPAVLAGGAGGRPSINITTGPVMQQGGQQWVTVGDLQAAVGSAVVQARGDARRLIAQPSSRMALGIS